MSRCLRLTVSYVHVKRHTDVDNDDEDDDERSTQAHKQEKKKKKRMKKLLREKSIEFKRCAKVISFQNREREKKNISFTIDICIDFFFNVLFTIFILIHCYRYIF